MGMTEVRCGGEGGVTTSWNSQMHRKPSPLWGIPKARKRGSWVVLNSSVHVPKLERVWISCRRDVGL